VQERDGNCSQMLFSNVFLKKTAGRCGMAPTAVPLETAVG